MALFDPFLHLDEEKAEVAKTQEESKSNAERGEWFSNVAKSYAKREFCAMSWFSCLTLCFFVQLLWFVKVWASI